MNSTLYTILAAMHCIQNSNVLCYFLAGKCCFKTCNNINAVFQAHLYSFLFTCELITEFRISMQNDVVIMDHMNC